MMKFICLLSVIAILANSSCKQKILADGKLEKHYSVDTFMWIDPNSLEEIAVVRKSICKEISVDTINAEGYWRGVRIKKMESDKKTIDSLISMVKGVPIVEEFVRKLETLPEKHLTYDVNYDDSQKIYRVWVIKKHGDANEYLFCFRIDPLSLKILNPDGRIDE